MSLRSRPERSRPARAALLATLLAVLGPAAAGPTAENAPEPLRIEIDFPPPGTRVGAFDGRLLVSGRVSGLENLPDRHDLIFLIDVSSSTDAPSGIDVDRDGEIDTTKRGEARRRRARQPGWKGNPDSILAAEIAAVRTLLDELDPRSTRVGVVTFSGDSRPRTPDAVVWLRPTSDHARVRNVLNRISLEAPQGGTNMGDGIRTALRALRTRKAKTGAATPSAESARRAEHYVIFLTDGSPSLSYWNEADLSQDALEAARQAAADGVRILSFAIGADAVEDTRIPREVARLTRGRFVAVRNLATLSADVASVSFGGLESVALHNRTLDAGASCLIVAPDGRFAALVPARPGPNAIEVRARSTRASEARADLTVELAREPSRSADLDRERRGELLRLRTRCESPDPRERRIDIEVDDGAARPTEDRTSPPASSASAHGVGSRFHDSRRSTP